MMHTRNSKRWGRVTIVFLLSLLVGGLTLGGCGNDPVAPTDTTPTLSPRDVAAQAGYAAMAATIVGPQTINFQGKSDKDSYTYTFAGDVTGRISLDYYASQGGAPAPWQTAGYVELATFTDETLVVSVGIGGTIQLTFDLAAAITFDGGGNRTSATLDGSGTYDSGPYDAGFSFAGLVINAGDSYPGAGAMTFTSGGVTATVSFDGSNTATLSLSTGETYTVNLDDGELS